MKKLLRWVRAHWFPECPMCGKHNRPWIHYGLASCEVCVFDPIQDKE